MAFRRRGWRVERVDQSAATPTDPVAPRPSVDDASDALGLDTPAEADRAALPVDEASVAELREGLRGAGDNLDEAANALDDVSADGPDDLTGSTGRLGSANTLGDTPDLDSRLSGPDAPTTGDDLAPTVGFDDPLAGDDSGEVTDSTLGGVSDPTGFGMGDTGSSTPDDLRRTDESTMTDADYGEGMRSAQVDQAAVQADVDSQLDPSGGGSDATSGITDAAANEKAYVDDAAGQAADQAFVERHADAQVAAIQKAIRGDDPAQENPEREPEPETPETKPDEKPEPEPDENIGKPPPETEPETEPEPRWPDPKLTPRDGPGTVARMDPDADPVAPLQGREPAMGDVINLGPEVGIDDSPDSLKPFFTDEDEWSTPTPYDLPSDDTNDFGRVDPDLYIEEGDGDMEMP